MTVTGHEALSLLKNRAKTVQLCGQRIDLKSEPKTFRYPGYFQPPKRIHLRSEGAPRAMLFTFLHEIGHFWSFTVGRRGPDYGRDVEAWRDWVEDISRRIMKRPEMQRYPTRRAVPQRDWCRAFGEEATNVPSPLDLKRRRQLLDEEERAWAFAYATAEALAFGPDALEEMISEARRSLKYYCDGLGFPMEPDWTPNVASLQFSPKDRSYVSELTRTG